ncbi:MAG: hypothetical protein RIR00_224 [Pseudomonadota bacterium]|jgi:diguanylate cyclase (GGDEF)-like protein
MKEKQTNLVEAIVAITDLRQRQQLEKALTDTIAEQLGDASVRLYDLGDTDGQQRARLEMEAEQAACLPLLDALLAAGTTQSPPPAGRNERGLLLPMQHYGDQISAIGIQHHRGLDDADLRLAAGLVRIYQNFLKLIDEKDHDRLTGLLNRSRLEAQITDSLEYNARFPGDDSQHGPQERRQNHFQGRNWLAVLDIDHFKQINDRFGHIYGDEVLLLLSAMMRKCFRRHDQLFRYGGEEFIVIVKHVDKDGAYAALQRFRRNIEAFDFPQVGRVTISIGFVQIERQDTPTTVIGHADQALYYAKTHGRNQVMEYKELVSAGELKAESIEGSIELF